ncbi:transposase [Vibrio parahaemolyticus]|nr:transposase [Vibrio parahaemolyticus]
MAKPRYKTTNWIHYNQALVNRGSLTFWIDEEAINYGSKSSKEAVGDLACLVT